MKNNYTSPSITVVELDNTDILTTSPGTESSVIPGGNGGWDWD